MRFRFLLRLFAVLLILFVVQKVVFMLYNMGMADGAPFLSCLAALWHGLRLDVATACYLVIIPTVVLIVSFFFQRFPLRRVLGHLVFYNKWQVTVKPAMTMLTIDMSLIRILRDGPEVSLNGSPTVSPTTVALWQSEPLPPK